MPAVIWFLTRDSIELNESETPIVQNEAGLDALRSSAIESPGNYYGKECGRLKKWKSHFLILSLSVPSWRPPWFLCFYFFGFFWVWNTLDGDCLLPVWLCQATSRRRICRGRIYSVNAKLTCLPSRSKRTKNCSKKKYVGLLRAIQVAEFSTVAGTASASEFERAESGSLLEHFFQALKPWLPIRPASSWQAIEQTLLQVQVLSPIEGKSTKSLCQFCQLSETLKLYAAGRPKADPKAEGKEILGRTGIERHTINAINWDAKLRHLLGQFPHVNRWTTPLYNLFRNHFGFTGWVQNELKKHPGVTSSKKVWSILVAHFFGALRVQQLQVVVENYRHDPCYVSF